jgi:D-xylose transport system substrate-binding protein
MRKGILTIAAVGLLATGGLTACGDDAGSGSTDSKKTPKIGVILPDSKSSVRWETADRRFLEEAFKAAGVQSDIQNAQNDKSQGVATIDYDRLTLGGSAQYYVSFDNEVVGKLQGEGLSKCLTEKGAKNPVVSYLNGSPTDNNATLFKAGYDSVLKPKFDSNEYVKGPEDAVPAWDNAQAATIFEQQLTKANGKIDGVLAANDGLGNAAISILKKNKLNGKVPVTGQDASTEGLQNILAGDQCMTVYKAVREEAKAASDLAIALAKGEKKDTGQTVKDPEGNRDVPSVLLTPKAIYKDNIKDVIADGYVTKEEVCTAAYAKACADAGIS